MRRTFSEILDIAFDYFLAGLSRKKRIHDQKMYKGFLETYRKTGMNLSFLLPPRYRVKRLSDDILKIARGDELN